MPKMPLLAALILAAGLVPTLAAAAGCDHNQQEARISCAEGTVWDEAAKACVTASS